MTAAAIADHGLDTYEGDVRGPGPGIRCGRPAATDVPERGPAGVRAQYGSGVLDSSLLRMSSVGFVSPYDRCGPPPWRRWTAS
jgi:hypothetical protein